MIAIFIILAASFTSPPSIYIYYIRYTRCELVEPNEYPRDIIFPIRSPLSYWFFIVPFRNRYNTSFFSQISWPEKPFFFIIIRKITKFKSLNTARRKRLVKSIFRENIEIRPYTNYIKTGERYIADRNYNKYTGYIRNTKSSCNLVISEKNWNKLNIERIRLSKTVARKKKKPPIPFKKYRVLRRYRSY